MPTCVTLPSDDVLVEPVGTPCMAWVLLHGLGMDPQVLVPFVQSLALPGWCLVPSGPVDTGSGGRAWWAVDPAKRRARLNAGASDLHDRHPHGREPARAALSAALQRLRRHSGSLPVALVGFSQGGMLAMDHSLLGEGPAPAGLALLSSTCIALDEWAPHWSRLRGVPALVAHGRDDDDLAFGAGERLRDGLIGAGAKVQWLPFDGGHQLPLVVWRALRRFLTEALPVAPVAPSWPAEA